MLGNRQRLKHFQSIKEIGKNNETVHKRWYNFFEPGKPIYTGDRFIYF